MIRKLLQRDERNNLENRKHVLPTSPTCQHRNLNEDTSSRNLNNLSFNSEPGTFNDDSLDESNRTDNRFVYQDGNVLQPEDKLEQQHSEKSGYEGHFDWTSGEESTITTSSGRTVRTTDLVFGCAKERLDHPPTRSYISVDRQLVDYRKVQGDNYRTLRRHRGGHGGPRMCC